MDYVPQTALEKLNELYNSGFITKWEYDNRKKELGEDEDINSNNGSNNNNTNSNSNNFDYNSNNNNNNSSSSYDYNQVIPVLNNDFEHDTNNYYQQVQPEPEHDYNQVIPVLNDYYTQPTSPSYETSSYETPSYETPSYDYYSQPTTTTNETPSYDYYTQPITSTYGTPSYDYYSNTHTTPIETTTPDTIPYNNYNSEVIEEEEKVIFREPITPKKNLIISNRHIDEKKAKQVKEYPLKVEKGYTIYKDIGNNSVLYFKDKECNYQSNLISLENKSKTQFLIEIYKFVGLEYGKSTSELSIYKLIIDDKRVARDNDFYNYGGYVEKTKTLINFHDDELTKPNHLLIEIGSFPIHRTRWNPTSKFTSSFHITQTTEIFKGYQGTPIKMDRNKYPYVIDKFVSDSSIPQFGFIKYNGTQSESYYENFNKNYKQHSNNYKVDVVKDKKWLKLNFLLLLRYLQNGSSKYSDLVLSNQSIVDILDPLRSSITLSKCLVCLESCCYGSFLCNKHHLNNLVDAYDQCKEFLFIDDSKDEQTLEKEKQENQTLKLKLKKEKDEETVFIKEKFAYCLPADLQSKLFKNILKRRENYDSNNYNY